MAFYFSQNNFLNLGTLELDCSEIKCKYVIKMEIIATNALCTEIPRMIIQRTMDSKMTLSLWSRRFLMKIRFLVDTSERCNDWFSIRYWIFSYEKIALKSQVKMLNNNQYQIQIMTCLVRVQGKSKKTFSCQIYITT